MSEILPTDAQPKSGEWVDRHRFDDLTDEEIAEGERLGAGTPDEDFIILDGRRVLLSELDEEDG